MEMPCASDQCDQVSLHMEAYSVLEAGQEWAVLPAKWWLLWCQWASYTGPGTAAGLAAGSSPHAVQDATCAAAVQPSVIQLSRLVEDAAVDDNDTVLRKPLTENEDYALVPKPVWLLLRDWFGSDTQVIRRVVSVGVSTRTVCRVDLWPISIRVTRYGSSDKKPALEHSFPGTTELKDVRTYLAQHWHIAPHNVRLWALEDNDDPLLLDDAAQSQTLDELGFANGQKLSVECKTKDLWPSETGAAKPTEAYGAASLALLSKSPPGNTSGSSSRSGYSLGGYMGWGAGGAYNASPITRGICGLRNLGNTCFMNSALQCLAATQPLTRYFLSGAHKADLNVTNVLGTGGKLATEYAKLLSDMWSGSHSSVSPTAFKRCIGSFAPQFSGYQQHDSQELLAYLLDGLHEDLNRVTVKPYTETPEGGPDRPDHEVAEEAWQVHLQRNQSVIVDHFQAQLKSRVECPDCGRVSITFDPFMYVSVPLPVSQTRLLYVTYVPKDASSTPRRVAVTVAKKGPVTLVLDAVAELVGAASHAMVLADVADGRVCVVLEGSYRNISSIRASDRLYAFQVPDALGPAGAKATRVLQMVNSRPLVRQRTVNFAYPFLLALSDEATGTMVYDAVMERVAARYARPGAQLKRDALPFVVCRGATGEQVPDSDDVSLLSRMRDRGQLQVLWDAEAYSDLLDTEHAAATEADPSVAAVAKAPSSRLTLHRCLERFTQPERLSEDNKWYCSVCKDHKRAEKHMTFWSLPEVLVVHLKRFQYTRWWRDKIGSVVDFPIDGLDMSSFVPHQEGPCTYNLFAVSNHTGNLGGGHYTAVVRGEDGSWYHCNDSHTQASKGSNLATSSAYVLFYRRAAPGQAQVDPADDVDGDIHPTMEHDHGPLLNRDSLL